VFCWVIADKDTGDVEHCYYDTGPGAERKAARMAAGSVAYSP